MREKTNPRRQAKVTFKVTSRSDLVMLVMLSHRPSLGPCTFCQYDCDMTSVSQLMSCTEV